MKSWSQELCGMASRSRNFICTQKMRWVDTFLSNLPEIWRKAWYKAPQTFCEYRFLCYWATWLSTFVSTLVCHSSYKNEFKTPGHPFSQLDAARHHIITLWCQKLGQASSPNTFAGGWRFQFLCQQILHSFESILSPLLWNDFTSSLPPLLCLQTPLSKNIDAPLILDSHSWNQMSTGSTLGVGRSIMLSTAFHCNSKAILYPIERTHVASKKLCPNFLGWHQMLTRSPSRVYLRWQNMPTMQISYGRRIGYLKRISGWTNRTENACWYILSRMSQMRTICKDNSHG